MKMCIINLFLIAFLSTTGANPTNNFIEDIDLFNEKLAETAQNMAYLGTYGNKGWYTFNEAVNQSEARSNCINYGMKLGIVDSQAELEFIANAAKEPIYHTDGNLLGEPSSFRWSTGLRELNPNLKIWKGSYGLYVNTDQKRLQSPGWGVPTFPYLCFMSLVANEQKDKLIDVVGGSLEQLENFSTFSNQTLLTGLTYIGRYGYKSFYYDNSLVHWPTAKENCVQMGMTFVRFDSQDELEWILSVVPEESQTDTIWTDGETKPGPQSWYWISTGTTLNSGLTTHDPSWGLSLSRSQGYLNALGKERTYPYICFIANTN